MNELIYNNRYELRRNIQNEMCVFFNERVCEYEIANKMIEKI